MEKSFRGFLLNPQHGGNDGLRFVVLLCRFALNAQYSIPVFGRYKAFSLGGLIASGIKLHGKLRGVEPLALF